MDQWKDQSINEWVDAISYHGDNHIGNRSSSVPNREEGGEREIKRREREIGFAHKQSDLVSTLQKWGEQKWKGFREPLASEMYACRLTSHVNKFSSAVLPRRGPPNLAT